MGWWDIDDDEGPDVFEELIHGQRRRENSEIDSE